MCDVDDELLKIPKADTREREECVHRKIQIICRATGGIVGRKLLIMETFSGSSLELTRPVCQIKLIA